MSFGYVFFGIMSLGLMSFGVMSFGLLSVYHCRVRVRAVGLGIVV